MTNFTQQIGDPSICIVHCSRGQRISDALGRLLNPVDPRTFHEYRLPGQTDVELHYHDFDEYWWFTSGHPRVTLRSPGGVVRQFDLKPGDMVACVRGVEHTLWADHELVYFQFSSIQHGGEREGHLIRQGAAAVQSDVQQ